MRNTLRQIRGLQTILEREMSVSLIAEPLMSVDSGEQASDVATKLRARDFDVCGIKRGDTTTEIVHLIDLVNGLVGDHAKSVPLPQLLSPQTPLWACLERVASQRFVFVLGNGQLESIVTLADLDKPPSRMLLFGLISVLEMVLLALIRKNFNGSSWESHISSKRLDKAKRLHELRRQKNQHTELIECLQICDKSTICRTLETVTQVWDLNENAADEFFREIEDIRNHLAHAQSPAHTMGWDEVAKYVAKAHVILTRSLPLLGNENDNNATA